MAGIRDDDEKYKDIEALGTLLKNTREAKGLSREEVGRWILDEEKVAVWRRGKKGISGKYGNSQGVCASRLL